MDHQQFIKNYL